MISLCACLLFFQSALHRRPHGAIWKASSTNNRCSEYRPGWFQEEGSGDGGKEEGLTSWSKEQDDRAARVWGREWALLSIWERTDDPLGER